MTFEQYYSGNYTRLVLQLAKKIGSLEEAEDRVQDVFTSLLPRKDFCEVLIQNDEFDKYVQGAINKQPAQVFREKHKQVPTVSIDSDNIDFLSSIRSIQSSDDGTEAELNDFYEIAIKLLENNRKLASDCGFETVGELRQYIFIYYCRNGWTFEEIGKRVNLTPQNISLHYGEITTILTPTIRRFIEGG